MSSLDRIAAGPAAGNAPLVRRLYEAFGRGDVETLLQMLADDVEWTEPENPFNPAAGTHRGPAGVLEWLRIGRETEDIVKLEPRRFVADGDLVVVIGSMQCRAKQTGRTYESDFVHLVTLVNSRITRFQEFFDTFAAAEAFRPQED